MIRTNGGKSSEAAGKRVSLRAELVDENRQWESRFISAGEAFNRTAAQPITRLYVSAGAASQAAHPPRTGCVIGAFM